MRCPNVSLQSKAFLESTQRKQRKEIIKINVRINETKNKYMRINKAKSLFYGNDTPGNIHEREKKNKNKHY